MAFGCGKKEDERYCYNCMAILPTKEVFDNNMYGSTLIRVCCKCLKEVKPPEENQNEA